MNDIIDNVPNTQLPFGYKNYKIDDDVKDNNHYLKRSMTSTTSLFFNMFVVDHVGSSLLVCTSPPTFLRYFYRHNPTPSIAATTSPTSSTMLDNLSQGQNSLLVHYYNNNKLLSITVKDDNDGIILQNLVCVSDFIDDNPTLP